MGFVRFDVNWNLPNCMSEGSLAGFLFCHGGGLRVERFAISGL